MTLFTFFLILTAAILHAVWNAVVKSSTDRFLSLAFINLGHLICGLGAMVFVFDFISWRAVPWLIASVIVHQLYYFALAKGYRYGDLGLTYPISRGIAPVLVALSAWIIWGQALTPMATVAVLCVSGGVLLLALERQQATAGNHKGRAIAYALLSGATIAAYTISDGQGVRAVAEPFAYIAWLFVLDALPAIVTFSALRGLRGWTAGWRYGGKLSLFGGLLSAFAYAAVIWAMALTPFASVSALRETSVIFAALIGVLFLRERFTKIRFAAACIVAAGVVIMKLG